MSQDTLDLENSSVDCPINCPNRKLEAKQHVAGIIAGYSFSIVCLLFAFLSNIEYRNNQFSTKEEPPLLVWIILFPMAGVGVGIRIDADTLGQLISIKK